jgi:LacI family transcriptional regulator
LAHQAARELLIRQPELTAISCYNDLVAIGVLQAAHDLGRRVPHDLATVGFDDIPLASLITPKLTSMHVPRFELGQMLMQMLLRVIAADGRHQEQLETKLELVVRESCGTLLAEKPTPSTL